MFYILWQQDLIPISRIFTQLRHLPTRFLHVLNYNYGVVLRGHVQNISSEKASVCRPTKVQPIPSSGQRLWKKMQLNQRGSHPMQIKHTPKTLHQEKRRVPSAEPGILCSSALNMVNICQKVNPPPLNSNTQTETSSGRPL